MLVLESRDIREGVAECCFDKGVLVDGWAAVDWMYKLVATALVK